MKGKFLKKALAASLALMIVAGSVPTYPNVDLFLGTSVTASAEEQGTQTVNFTTAGSITNIDYYVYVGNSTDPVTKPESVNIEGGTEVKVNVAYNSGYKPMLTAECTVSNSINVTSSDDSGNRIVTYKFTMPLTGNVNVQIQMNPRYSTLTVADTENGTVSVRSPKANYPTGERVYLDITPNEGYTISTSVYSYNEGSGMYTRQIQNDESGYYIEMPQADTTVNVQFSKIQSIIFDNDEERGTVELISPESAEKIHENTYVYLKVTPSEGYKLKNIHVESLGEEIEVNKNGGYENEFYFLMPDSDVVVTTVYSTIRKVTVNEAENGTVTIKNDSDYVDSGDKVLLDVKPDEGYALSDLWCKADGTFHPSDIDENGYYYFEMPEHNVEVNAEFVEGRTVTVDLGEGHEELAQMFSGINGYTVNGTEISYAVSKYEYTVGAVEEDFSNRAREIALGEVIDADGKKFMGEIRLHSEYQSEELYQQELGSNLSAEGVTFKAMWAEPISELTITAPDYKCGQELTTSTQDSTTRYKPCNVQLSEGVSLRDYHLFYTNWLMENNETILRGGNNYNIYGYIQANYNTYLTDDLSINVKDGELVSYDPKWSRFEISVPIEHDLDENGVCTSCGEKVYSDGIGERLAGHSLSLTGNIGVNFYMELDDAVAADENSYMHFILPNGTTQDVTVAQAKTRNISGKTYYVFQCEVAAKEMTDTIKAQMFSGDKSGEVYEYTVKDYADYILANTQEPDYEKAAPLVKAMLNYGTYSQEYFGHNTDNPANAGLDEADKALGDVTVDHSAPVVNNLPDGVTFEGASLSLESETRLSLYFKNISEAPVTFKLGDNSIEPVENNGYLQINITGIKANELSNDFVVTIGDSGSVTYSPMNYCKTVLDGDYSEKLNNTVKALYKYSQAADEYFSPVS